MCIKKHLILLLLLLCALPLCAKDSKVVLSPGVLYVGEANKKIPSGQGTLYVMCQSSKEPIGEMDVISGVFSGNLVTSAEIRFSTGWKFKGDVSYNVIPLSKKPLQTKITYNLTGKLFSPDGEESYNLTNADIVRTADGQSFSLISEDMSFKVKRETKDGVKVDYMLYLRNEGSKWKSTSYMVVAPSMLFQGHEVVAVPNGAGTLYLGVTDVPFEEESVNRIEGVFVDNHAVSSAEVHFTSGWSFTGDLSYMVDNQGGSAFKVEYLINGKLFNNRKECVWEGKGLRLAQTFANIQSKLIPFSLDEIVPVKVTDQNYLVFTNCSDAHYSLSHNISQTEDGNWKITTNYPSKYKEYFFDSGHIITEISKNEIIVQYPWADYLHIRGSQIVELLKTFPECIVHFGSIDSDEYIYYTDGSVYEGTFTIDGLRYNAYYQTTDQLKNLMDPDLFINEIPLMYLDGLYTYANGKTENWKNGITDYQQNKINGNYDRVTASVAQYQREQKAAAAKELERKWQAAMPELKKRYGTTAVEDVYNYRLYRGLPLGLFEDLKSYGIIRMMGPIYSSHQKNTFNEYVVYVTNRTTGEIQYSQVLKFYRSPYSVYWRLYSYSSNF